MAKIKIMKEVLANKIAAGEVIERPLSVVKELVENSIDAKSTRIVIELKDSGISQIKITDNGIGMSEADLPLSIKRHATSKLYDDKDLFKISTLGFRGEALPSIYAVSKLTISSSTDGISGNQLSKIDDENFSVEPFAMNRGTIITVSNLFYNTPVRYKHLSNPFYELSLIVQYINKLAYIHKNVSFIVKNNENQVVHTVGNGDLRMLVANQYSVDIAKRMIEFNASNDHFEIEVITSHPHDTRSRKSHITIGLNERLIRNYDIENKIINSYGTFLHTGQFPIAFINIKVNYSLIDVNIHPTKQQVKISLIDNLLDLIEENIKSELSKLTYMAEPTEIKTFDYSQKQEEVNKQVEDQLDQLFEDVKPRYQVNDEKELPTTIIQPPKLAEQQNDQVTVEENHFAVDEVFKNNSDNVARSSDLFTLDNETNERNIEQKLPIFEFVGTLHNTYILCENGEGLYLIDQHAAQERINYEKISNSFKRNDFRLQQTLIPVIIDLTDSEEAIFKDRTEMTKLFGFTVEPFGLNTYKVDQVDTWLANRKNFEEDIDEIIHLIVENKAKDFSEYFDEVAISMACKKSIKAHQRVNQVEAIQLLKELNLTSQPYTCPHGRPVIVKITTHEIEKMFKRVF